MTAPADDRTHPAVTALAAVVADAAGILRVPVPEIAVELLEARQWPDTCLGLDGPDEGCGDAITPGYRVTLGDGLAYRTDTDGNIRRETGATDRELFVRFRQTGGIGGWSSEYVADDTSLTVEEADSVRRFIDEAGFFKLPAEVGNGDPIADGYSYTLFLAHGRRNHTVHTYDGGGPAESPALMAFIGWLAERAPDPAGGA
jgi:hypothetical protein